MIPNNVQIKACKEYLRAKGLVGALGVGVGKTYLAALIMHLDPMPTVYFCPSRIASQAKEMLEEYRTFLDFEMPLIVTYSDLSLASNLLKSLDYCQRGILDEAHNVRRMSARSRRFRKWAESKIIVLLSGTLLTEDITEYAPLVKLALKDKSPIPDNYMQQVSMTRVMKGIGTPFDVRRWPYHHKGMLPKDAYFQHFSNSPGIVVQDSDTDCNASLYAEMISVEVPSVINDLLLQLEKTWELPGYIVVDATHKASLQAQLHHGFYYKWAETPHIDWLMTRSKWSQTVRKHLKNAEIGEDTASLFEKAIIDGKYPQYKGLYKYWLYCQKMYPEPSKEVVWIDSYLVDFCNNYDKESIIWCEFSAFFDKLYHQKKYALKQSSEGLNLQHINKQFFPIAPNSPTAAQQSIGRCHRKGQTNDVTITINIATEVSKKRLKSTLLRSESLEALGSKSKLLLATGKNYVKYL